MLLYLWAFPLSGSMQINVDKWTLIVKKQFITIKWNISYRLWFTMITATYDLLIKSQLLSCRKKTLPRIMFRRLSTWSMATSSMAEGNCIAHSIAICKAATTVAGNLRVFVNYNHQCSLSLIHIIPIDCLIVSSTNSSLFLNQIIPLFWWQKKNHIDITTPLSPYCFVVEPYTYRCQWSLA